MKIGIHTDSLGHLSLDELLPTIANLGIKFVELGCGNWSKAPHINLDEMLDSQKVRLKFLSKLNTYGLEISGLNCSGNQLAPGKRGKQHNDVVYKTFRLAGLLGVKRIMMMSGCPGGPGDANLNWITTDWPPEFREMLKWQWEKIAIPYWQELVSFAKDTGITHICVEPHGGQLVYNTETMLRLREISGEEVGCNFDPSHMMWMGGDPLAAISKLKDIIYHIHAKDTRINPVIAGLNTLLETKPEDQFLERSWNYITLGYGHDEKWWFQFLDRLSSAGYNGVLSIEHEDLQVAPLEGVKTSVQLLQKLLSRISKD